MKLLYGTANPAKIKHMREILRGLDLEIIGLEDIKLHVESINESGKNPLINSQIKALAYYSVYKRPIFSCDSGLYFEGIQENLQPGVHVRRINEKYLNDEEMIEYYTNLAALNGGEVIGRYRNAITLIIDDKHIYSYDGDDLSSERFILSSKPHHKRNYGFPLDSISIDIKTNKYYMDLHMNKASSDDELAEGFRNFFKRTIMDSTLMIKS